MRVLRNAGPLVLALMLAGTRVTAQEPAARPAAEAQAAGQSAQRGQPGFDQPVSQEAKKVDIILPHISDSDEIDYPWPNASGYRVWHLPHWAPVMIGSYALDLSPTIHWPQLLADIKLIPGPDD